MSKKIIWKFVRLDEELKSNLLKMIGQPNFVLDESLRIKIEDYDEVEVITILPNEYEGRN